MLPWPSSLSMSPSGKVRESPFVIQLPLQRPWGSAPTQHQLFPGKFLYFPTPSRNPQKQVISSLRTISHLPPIGAESPDRLSYLATVSELNGTLCVFTRSKVRAHAKSSFAQSFHLRASQVIKLPRTRYCPDYLPIGTCSIHEGRSPRTFTWFVQHLL